MGCAICWESIECAGPLCALVVEAREAGRFRLLEEVAVLDRERDLPLSLGKGSVRSSQYGRDR